MTGRYFWKNVAICSALCAVLLSKIRRSCSSDDASWCENRRNRFPSSLAPPSGAAEPKQHIAINHGTKLLLSCSVYTKFVLSVLLSKCLDRFSLSFYVHAFQNELVKAFWHPSSKWRGCFSKEHSFLKLWCCFQPRHSFN